MNIDPTRLTYSPIPKSPNGNQHPRIDPSQMNPAEMEPKEEIKPSESKRIESPGNQASGETQWASPLSNYLSPEEKTMLNELFPPSGRDIGIRAYRRGQQPVRDRMELGKRIDIKT